MLGGRWTWSCARGRGGAAGRGARRAGPGGHLSVHERTEPAPCTPGTARRTPAGASPPTGTPVRCPTTTPVATARRRPPSPSSAFPTAAPSRWTMRTSRTSRRNQVDVQAFWLGAGATIEIHPGVGLFAMSHAFASTVEDGGLVDVTSGFLGGEGTVRVHGDVSIAASSITGASSLISTPGTMPEGLQTQPGTLLVEQGGELSITNLGVGMRRALPACRSSGPPSSPAPASCRRLGHGVPHRLHRRLRHRERRRLLPGVPGGPHPQRPGERRPDPEVGRERHERHRRRLRGGWRRNGARSSPGPSRCRTGTPTWRRSTRRTPCPPASARRGARANPVC